MTRVTNLLDAPTEFDAVFSARAEYHRSFMGPYNETLEIADPILFELARLRLAALFDNDFDRNLRFKPAQEAGLTEEKIAQLDDYGSSSEFTENEVAWLLLVEQYAIQVDGITDDDVAGILKWMPEKEFVVNLRAVYFTDALQRCVVALRIRPEATVPTDLDKFVPVAAPAQD